MHSASVGLCVWERACVRRWGGEGMQNCLCQKRPGPGRQHSAGTWAACSSQSRATTHIRHIVIDIPTRSLSLTLPLGNYTLRRPSAKCVLCFRHFTLDESQPQITHKFKPFSARQETNKMNPTFVMMLRHVKLTNNEFRYNHREN